MVFQNLQYQEKKNNFLPKGQFQQGNPIKNKRVGVKIHPFLINYIFIIQRQNNFMKNEYRDKVIDSLDIITMRTKLISDMIEGKKQANPQDAVKCCKEIDDLIERIKNTLLSRNSY